MKQLLRSCTSNEKTILYPNIPTAQSVCATRVRKRAHESVTGHRILASQMTWVGGLVYTRTVGAKLSRYTHIVTQTVTSCDFRWFLLAVWKPIKSVMILCWRQTYRHTDRLTQVFRCLKSQCGTAQPTLTLLMAYPEWVVRKICIASKRTGPS